MTSLLISSEDNFDIRVHTCPTFVSLMVGYNFAPIVCVRENRFHNNTKKYSKLVNAYYKKQHENKRKDILVTIIELLRFLNHT